MHEDRLLVWRAPGLGITAESALFRNRLVGTLLDGGQLMAMTRIEDRTNPRRAVIAALREAFAMDALDFGKAVSLSYAEALIRSRLEEWRTIMRGRRILKSVHAPYAEMGPKYVFDPVGSWTADDPARPFGSLAARRGIALLHRGSRRPWAFIDAIYEWNADPAFKLLPALELLQYFGGPVAGVDGTMRFCALLVSQPVLDSLEDQKHAAAISAEVERRFGRYSKRLNRLISPRIAWSGAVFADLAATNHPSTGQRIAAYATGCVYYAI